MSFAFSSAPPRRVAALFLALTLAPAMGLVWLGWRMLEQDRALEEQRAQERRERAADLAASALDREFSATRQRLAQPQQTPGLASSRDSLIALFRGQRIEIVPAGRLLFYPSAPPSVEAPGDVGRQFLTGEEYEFQRKDYAKAIEHFRELALSRDAAVRAGARLRLARNYRKAGELELALATYDELARAERISIAGVPAELAGRRARCSLLAETGRSDELIREARALHEDLLSGRWQLTRPVYELHASQAREWLGAVEEDAGGQLAVSEAVEWLWGQWQGARAGYRPVTDTTVVRLHDRCLTILAQNAGESLTALVAGPRFVETQWLSAATRAIRDESLRVHLLDGSGNTVSGQAQAISGRRTLRLASDTGLPWTVVVSSAGLEPETAQLASRRQLLFAGLALAVILVLTSGYLTARAVSRELGVARLKSEFVSAVSHEFRTPLATLRQLTENLSDGRVTTQERRDAYYQAQARATMYLHRLVERLLDFGRMEAGAFRYHPEAVDLGNLTHSVVDEFEHIAATSGHEIRVTIEPGLPQVNADPEALGQVVWNLLDNAIKYSPGRPAVWVEVAREDGHVGIRVRDQGFGIPAEERKLLFRKFVRGSAAQAAEAKGTGIGLAMVDNIVRAHGGRVRVDSVPGEGSTFAVLLKMEAQ
jgi:signal transduction histidine kinase